MHRWVRLLCAVSFAGLLAPRVAVADDPQPAPTACAAAVDYFTGEVWAKVGELKCLTCHQQGGDAEASGFLLLDPRKLQGAERVDALRQNLAAFMRMATVNEGDESRMLVKVTGGLDHGGADVLPPESAGFRILADFVRRVNGESPSGVAPATQEVAGRPFFDGVQMLDDRRLLRRATLSLAGRLPTSAELASIAQQSRGVFNEVLDGLLQEDAFYERLKEGFNDVFLTLGIDGNADQTVLSYEHFEKTRHWYQNYDLSHIADPDERQRTEWKIAAEYRQAILREPLELITHIVRNDRPFTEIVTADYIMVSPYSARGYGVFEELRDQFQDPDDPFEYVPVKIKALIGRSESENQESATGYYPHAGMLSTFQYLTRYPTTETNRNRLRARMYYQHFLGVDVLELAARVSDAAAVTAKFAVPTMEASECAVCHRTLDPVAGLFQDYWRFADQGVYGRRKDGWFTDMFAAGFEGEDLPTEERWRSLQWLGERTAKDPRFAIAMTQHVYYLLFGRRPLLPPKDLDDPLFAAHARAYSEQRRQTEEIAARFAAGGFNLKSVIKDWIASDFYRADGLTAAVADPCRIAELEDVGIVRLLSPEQLERKVNAVFGEPWGRLNDALATLYGGIDSKEVTDRAADPSGAMGAIQRMLANDVACRQVARDFARPAAERRLFPGIESTALPGESPESDAAIRQAIVRLHELILGRYDAADSAEVDRTYRLWVGLIEDARAQPGLDPRESYFCRPRDPDGNELVNGDKLAGDDPLYTLRAWRGVVTYLLRRPEFLYE